MLTMESGPSMNNEVSQDEEAGIAPKGNSRQSSAKSNTRMNSAKSNATEKSNPTSPVPAIELNRTSSSASGVTPAPTAQMSSRGRATPSSSKSSGRSGEVMFESKSRGRRKKATSPPGSHRVTFTVTIAKAISTGDEGDQVSIDDLVGEVEDDDKTQDTREEQMRKRKRIVEAPRAQNYYHCEYNLLPNDQELVKTDVVTFGLAAKLYTERQDAKVVKTWQEGGSTWVAWTHAHTVTITDDLLKKLYKHSLEFRVWDTKDKLSTKARYDRPKAFKLPTAKPGEDADGVGGVKSLVLKQCQLFEESQPKRSYITRPMPSQVTQVTPDTPSAEAEKGGSSAKSLKGGKSAVTLPPPPGSPTPSMLVQVNKAPDNGEKQYNHLGRLAGIDGPATPLDDRTGRKSQPVRGKSTSPKRKGSGMPDKRVEKSRPAIASKGKGKPLPPIHSLNPNQFPSLEFGSSLTTLPELPELLLDQQQRKLEPSGAQQEDAAQRSAESPPGKQRKNKKLEAEQQAALEQTKKYGVCTVPIKMAKLFAGILTVTERLEMSVSSIEDLFVTVSLSGPLMSEEQRRRLNPLVMTVHSATAMPATPLNYSDLRLKCQPAFVRYQWFDHDEHQSTGREQDDAIYWDDVNVFLAGTMEPSKLRQYLNGPPLQVQVHDRARVPEKHKLKPALFGDDLEDEKISNVGSVSSKRTIHNPFGGRPQPYDPHGVAALDMSGLLLGQQIMYLKVPVHACAAPDPLGQQDPARASNRVVGVAGAVDGPVETPLPVGHYLEAGAMLKVKIEVAHPIVTPAQLATKQGLDTTLENDNYNLNENAESECPFNRIIFKFDYKDVDFLQRIQSLVMDINAQALDLQDMPSHVIDAALSTYKLSLEQQRSAALDMVTGFQVLDGVRHLFVLEGLRDHAIRKLWETLPKPCNADVEVLYNSDLAFPVRLYGPLDVDLCRVKLHEPLDVIVQQPLLYVRDMVPRPCFDALVKLREMCQIAKMSIAVRSDLFPTADMIVSMSREFGVPMTAADFEELRPKAPSPEKEVEIAQEVQVNPTSRMWTPIDNQNLNYEELLDKRQEEGLRDYMLENMVAIRECSMLNQEHRIQTAPATVTATTAAPHNYSTQTLNSTEQAKETLRQLLAENPDRRFTYCDDFHHSMTVIPTNVEADKQQHKATSHSRWKTPQGFVYPGKKTMIASNKHPLRPHPARVDELQVRWEENTLHAKHRPTLQRDRYPWTYRQEDMDVWTRPQPVFGQNEPITIHLAGEKLREEKVAAQQAEQQQWRSKVIIDDPRSYFHRCATETELKTKGFKSSNQMDRLKSMLKDPPQKLSLQKPGFSLQEIPPLNVVLNPSIDTAARLAGVPLPPADKQAQQKVKGFVPGPYEGYSWTLARNQIPVQDYQHHTFARQKGHDFNVYHKEHSKLYKRRSSPLNDEEMDVNLFRLPPELQGRLYGHRYILPDVQDFMGCHGYPEYEEQKRAMVTLPPAPTARQATQICAE